MPRNQPGATGLVCFGMSMTRQSVMGRTSNAVSGLITVALTTLAASAGGGLHKQPAASMDTQGTRGTP